MTKELVDEKATRHDDCRDAIPTPCGRGSGCVSEASYNHRGGVHCEEGKPSRGLRRSRARLMRGAARRSNLWKECEKLFREHAPALLSFRNNISHTNCNGNPPTLTLPLKGGREQLDGNSGTPQSLINSNHFTHFTHLTHLTHFKKAATQIIRGAAKARFRRTLRAGLADARTAPYRKFGFTLAEVLVTLAVIGIVAAMTIPTLVNSYKEKATVAKVKKTYSTLANAYKLAILDYGTPDNWGLNAGWGNVTCNVDSEGNVNPLCGKGAENAGKILSKYMNVTKMFSYNDLLAEDEPKTNAEYRLILNDGMILGIFTYSDKCYSYIDKTGSTDACFSVTLYTTPDARHHGQDIFTFIARKNNIVPYGINEAEFQERCRDGKELKDGLGCTGWVVKYGNMDYLHCDDLSWDGKHKCSD